MEFTVRGFVFGDLFTLSKIIKKIDIKPFLKTVTSIKTTDQTGAARRKEDIEAEQKEKGLDVFMYIFENAGEAEIEVCKLVADITGLKIDAVRQFNLTDLKNLYEGIVKANSGEELKDFFKQAVGSKK